MDNKISLLFKTLLLRQPVLVGLFLLMVCLSVVGAPNVDTARADAPAGQPVLISPDGSADSFTPTYTWNQVPGATQYKLWIGRPNGELAFASWYSSAQAGCNGSQCQVTPDLILGTGSYQWLVKSYNSAGGEWSNPKIFTTPTEPADKPTLGTPSGSANSFTPTYTWNPVANATHYKLWVGRSNGQTAFSQWYSATQAACSPGCSVTPDAALGGGSFTWYIKAYNPAGGTWSELNSFTTPPAPGKPILQSPNGSLGTSLPSYTWKPVSDATHYKLWVGRPGGSTVFAQWYTVQQAACNASTCQVTPNYLTSGGSLTWYIKSYNPAGGEWSDALSFTLPASSAIAGCPAFPANNIWNARVDSLPLDAHSAAYITSIGATGGLHADFGSGTWDGGPIGIPFNLVTSAQGKVAVSFDYADESDAGPYPIPPNPLIEGGADSDGDRHILIVDQDACKLYELYNARQGNTGAWHAGSGAIFDLRSNLLRPATWTSADAAGLSILAGLARYEEILAGEITHALRFTVSRTQRAYVWQARHYASSSTDASLPPMGQRFRLKASFDVSSYPHDVQIILNALKKYGMIVADNGANWYISGAPDERWDNDILHTLSSVKGSNFEAVDVSSLMVNPDSGQAAGP